jgi:DnaK suppressor protein
LRRRSSMLWIESILTSPDAPRRAPRVPIIPRNTNRSTVMTLPNATLSEVQIDQIREELERTLRRAQKTLATQVGRSREIDQSAVGRLSRIEALQNQSFKDKLQERERTKFDEVVQALSRLDDGSYGVCKTCLKPIGFERLLVFPEALVCTSCRSGR